MILLVSECIKSHLNSPSQFPAALPPAPQSSASSLPRSAPPSCVAWEDRIHPLSSAFPLQIAFFCPFSLMFCVLFTFFTCVRFRRVEIVREFFFGFDQRSVALQTAKLLAEKNAKFRKTQTLLQFSSSNSTHLISKILAIGR